MQFRKILFSLFVICSFSAAYAVVPIQDRSAPQTRPAPGGGGQQGGRPPQGGNRPNPGGGNNGKPQPQPGRPNPGGGGNNRPQPGRPNPGGGNNRPQPGRPGPSRPPNRPSPGRPPQWGRPPANRPSYNFRPNDRSYLHRYYMRSLAGINRANRPRFVIGGFFPYGDISYLSPLPPNVYGYLPPPPLGYQMGYFQGYVVVYDPVTYFIANVIDLLQ